jgi:hypothetical protein
VAEVFEGDLTGALFWGADMRGARFRDVNLADVTITHAWLDGLDVDAFVDRVVINGVDVTSYVNEHDAWYPLRTVLRVAEPEEMRAGWAMLNEAWAATIADARQRPAPDLHESVDGEWSFVQTLRHLVLAMDKWFTDPILGEPFDPVGLPNRGSTDTPWPGLDADAAPSLTDVLAVRTDRAERFRTYLADLTSDELGRTVEVIENGPHTVQQCISTVFEEEFWHLRYARRDLEKLGATR